MKKKILLVEDEAELRENIQEILEISGYNTALANNGIEALHLLEKDTFDLVISDIMMPEMDGFTLLQNFREKEYWLETPFIFLTAKMDPKDQRRGMEFGAEDYLVKPVKAKELLAAVSIALKKKDERNQHKFDELKDEFGKQRKVFFHEMNTPLTSVIATLELLKACGQSISEEDFNLFLDQAMIAAKRLDTSLKSLRKYQSIDTINAVPDRLDSLEVFLKAYLGERHELKNISFICSKDSAISYTIRHLLDILEILLTNASRFSPEGSLITTHLNYPELVIANVQEAFSKPQQIVPKPFQQFTRDVHEQQGLGLGIFIAQQLALKNKSSLTFQINEDLQFESILNFDSF